MIELNPSQFKTLPFKHQLDGTKLICMKEACALFDEMGVGKSKQVVDAACVLYRADVIDTVIIACPAQVKIAWADEDFGEILKHAWVPSTVMEYSSRRPYVPMSSERLVWLVVSYEFTRSEFYFKMLKEELKGRRILIVADESSWIKSPQATQTRRLTELRRELCARAVILNGTPISNNPLDIFAQLNFLSPDILKFKNYYHFRAFVAEMAQVKTKSGQKFQKAVKFKNLDQLNSMVNPYVLRRTKDQVLDLPDKLYSVMAVPLGEEIWKTYCAMRDEMVAEIDEGRVTAQHATVKMIRLAQITSGFVGGYEQVDEKIEDGFVIPVFSGKKETKEIGDEKTQALLGWLREQHEADAALRVLVWCRFRAEIERLASLISINFPGYIVRTLLGGQSKSDRAEAVHEFQEGDVRRPAIIVGQPQAGGLGLNLTKCHRVVYLSNDYNLKNRLQSEDRVHRQGQTNHCTYLDIIATGPNGQKTIDHHVAKALQQKKEVANWTTAQWRKALTDE